MKTPRKLRKGLVRHYGAAILGIRFIAERLTNSLDSGRIADPDFSEEEAQRVYRENMSGGPRKSLGKDHNNERILRLYLNLEKGSQSGIRETPHPLTKEYLRDVELPIHLRRGLTLIRYYVDPIKILYSLKDYWEGIPFDPNTSIFYSATDAFNRGIQNPLERIEKKLRAEGYSGERRDNFLFINYLGCMTHTAYYIDYLGKEISMDVGELRPGEKTWNLKEVSSGFIP